MQPDASRDILGLWIEGIEGFKSSIILDKVFNDLKTRGVGG